MLKYLKLAIITVFICGSAGLQPLHAQWTDDGISLGDASGAQDTPAITADSTGGAVIVWRDARPAVNTDIYAQGVTADGSIRWYPQGMPVCTASNSQSAPMVIADGTGGTIVVWQDSRSGSTLDIYAQKLSTIGYIQWGTDGVAICTGQTGLSLGDVVSDGAGGAIITWYDRRNFYSDIFVQRIASNGSVMWTSGGVAVCTADMHQQNPVLAPDGANGAIIAWEDRRNGGYDIYAQRVDSDGSPQWTDDGVVICDSGDNQMTPRIVEDGSGGAVVAWSDRRNTMDFDIFAQRVNSTGVLQWGYGTPVSAWMNDQKNCRLVHIGSGQAIVTWEDGRSGSSSDIYAQKLDSGGTCQWTSNGVVVCDSDGDQENAVIAANGSGGAFISWDDERNGTDNINICAQNIDSGGNSLWASGGVAMCDASANQHQGVISGDGSEGMFLAWTDNRSGTGKAYAHRVDDTGNIPTATLLQNYSVESGATGITIHWSLSEIDPGVNFRIFRAGEPFLKFEEIRTDGMVEEGLSFSFIDRTCKPGISYHYRIFYGDAIGSNLLFQAGPVTVPVETLALHQNRPNPFNPSTVIYYTLAQRRKVRLEVFDVKGCLIRVLADEWKSGGNHNVVWNGRDEQGTSVASGVYFYRLTAGKKTLTRRMVLLR